MKIKLNTYPKGVTIFTAKVEVKMKYKITEETKDLLKLCRNVCDRIAKEIV